MIPIDEYGRHGRPEVSPAIEIDQGARWDEMYREKPSDRLSWFQEHPSLSLHLITDAAPNRDARIIDVGGGDSLLVDHLLERGYRHITVLDISGSAIERTQSRLGSRADPVRWVVGDVLTTGEIGMYDVWHDRALFHFLIEPQQRQQYVEAVTRTVVPQGTVIIATFAPDGPPRCSGLGVRRYDERSLAAELGESFALVKAVREAHLTPWDVEQQFAYASFRKLARARPSLPCLCRGTTVMLRRESRRSRRSPGLARTHNICACRSGVWRRALHRRCRSEAAVDVDHVGGSRP